MTRVYFSQLKKTWLFDIFIIAVLTVCILMIGIFGQAVVASTAKKSVDKPQNYECYFASLNGEGTIEEFFAKADIGTNFDIGTMGNRFVANFADDNKEGSVINSAFARNTLLKTKKGNWFSAQPQAGITEMIVHYSLRDQYAIGEAYEMSGVGKVKIIDYLYNDYNFYFQGNGASFLRSKESKFLLCSDELLPINSVRPDGTKYYSSKVYVFGDVDKEKLLQADETFYRQTFDEVYKAETGAFKDALFMIVLIELLLMLSMATNTLVTLRVSNKRNAVNFLCGASDKQIVGAEILRMAIVFAVPIVVNLALLPIMMTAKMFGVVEFACAIGLVAVSYGVGIIARIIQIVQSNHLNVLRGNV